MLHFISFSSLFSKISILLTVIRVLSTPSRFLPRMLLRRSLSRSRSVGRLSTPVKPRIVDALSRSTVRHSVVSGEGVDSVKGGVW